MKHYKSVKILSNFKNVPLRKFKPLFKIFWRLVSNFHIFSRDSLVAFHSYQCEKVRKTRIVNLTATTIWVHFT